MASIPLWDYARFTKLTSSHHQAFWNALDQALTPEQRTRVAPGGDLRGIWEAAGSEINPRPTNPLTGFPYFCQQDNGPQGWRQCQTSSIAMCLAYLKVPGIRDDLDYLRIVQRHGDTTAQATHVAALAELKVKARFRTNMSSTDLLGELKAGLPVAIGLLHHGPANNASGGGHYVAVYGYDTAAGCWIVNDPFGSLDLINGGWSSQVPGSGRAQRYSFRNMNPRWLADGNATCGWGWVFS